MFRRFLPKNTDFFDYLEQHSNLIIETCKELHKMSSDKPDVVASAARIKEIEQQADVITHKCTEDLLKTFITPIDRSDILALIKRMDDIIDFIFASTSRMDLYEIRELKPEAKELSAIILESAEKIHQAISGLRNMKHAAEIKEICIQIHHLEDHADGLFRNAIVNLFRQEEQPIQVIKWKEILERLEKATDRCDDVANILEKVIIEST
ncbi:MAG: DUF47 family protein [Candidatus Omnitrophica bacterium]|jgi:predicted phosphate transport protein (TIGR00153 family)|nr:MAG: putative pit accessory protein [Candidatus Hinthialibacteria bacterium OLB16]MBE7488176.1 DUF47 domain-containing protein [bacterium]MBW7937435.1 DUF47 domain-containing protein [Candidatus Omnitrophota bacterium]MCE7906991.1 DUF47 domain-containing protein [Candidatus Omnitrophica bacterium COP1]MBV6482763.1 hypothetical protein [bacterium]